MTWCRRLSRRFLSRRKPEKSATEKFSCRRWRTLSVFEQTREERKLSARVFALESKIQGSERSDLARLPFLAPLQSAPGPIVQVSRQFLCGARMADVIALRHITAHRA